MTLQAVKINLDEHPAELLARAHELQAEAAALLEQSKAKRCEAAILESKAKRLREAPPPARKPAGPPDRLLAAAALAVEDLAGVYGERELAAALAIRDLARARRLLIELAAIGAVTRVREGYRTQDPDAGRVRNGARELGTFWPAELADKLELPVAAVERYMTDGEQEGWISRAADGHLMFLRPGPERLITRRPKRPTPEQSAPGAGSEAPARGEAVFTDDSTKRRDLMSKPGQGHRERQRAKRRRRNETRKQARQDK